MRRGVLAAFALTFTLVSPAHAALDAWSFGDQPGGVVATLAVSGQNALAAPQSSAGGLFRSADGGAAWQRLGGLGYRRVSSVAIDPAAGQPWYAATTTGLFRSLDHGDTWEVVATPLGTTASWSLVAVDRGTPGTAYIGSGTQIYRTTTGGSGTWTSVSTSAPSGGFDDILVDPVTHTAWGRRYGAGIYYVSSSGTAWTADNTGLPSTSVAGLALDGSAPRRLIVATTSGQATHSAAPGSWSAMNGGLTLTYGVDVSSDASGETYLTVLTGSTHFWRLAPGATTWTPVPVGGRPSEYSYGVVGDPATDGHVLALTSSQFAPNVGVGPMWRSVDAGGTWSAVSGFDGISVVGIAADSGTPGRVVVATRVDAAQRSQDFGATWGPGATGLPDVGPDAVAADGATPGKFYLATNGSGIYRSTDGGATWTAVGTGDPTSAPVLVGVPGTAGTVYAGSSATAYKSTDFGDSWATLPTLPGSFPYISDMAADPAAPGAVYAATTEGVDYLPSGGAAWQDRNTGIGAANVYSIAIDPRSPATLFATTSVGMLRSTNSGASWAPSSTGVTDTYLTDVVADPQQANTVYAAGPSGVWMSTDEGATWSLFLGGASVPAVEGLAFDADGRTLYAATQGLGVLARTRPAPAAPGGGGGGGGGGPVADTVPPVISKASLTHRRFAVKRLVRALAARKHPVPRGTSIRFTLSEAATVRFTVARRVTTKTHKHRYKGVGAFSRAAQAGASRVAFSGRLGKHALKHGSYRMTLVATDAAKNRSKAVVLKFTIV